MLREFLEQICRELDVETPKSSEKKLYFLPLTKEIDIALKDLEPGVAMQAQICPCPKERKEELFIYLMRANLLGQGTGGARLGLDQDEKFLTLSLGLPYELNYKIFKEALEDFANYLLHWKEMVTKFEREEQIY